MSNYVRDAFDRLCPKCHVLGEDPRLDPRLTEDSCAICDRTPGQIQAACGVVQLDVAMKCVVFARRAQAELKYSKGEMITLLVEGMCEK